ncbi:MAG: efflux RND transporter periplasmic adaptor subunit [Betaproteobacteria bacterium]
MSGDRVSPTILPVRQWLEQLSDWRGAPAEYWTQFAQAARALLFARAVFVCWRPTGADQRWQVLHAEPQDQSARLPDVLSEIPASLWQQMRQDGVAVGSAESARMTLGICGFRLEEPREMCLVAVLPDGLEARDRQARLLAAFAWLPAIFERDRQARQHARDAARLAQVLETVGRLLQAEQLDQAALILANDLAERFACETVTVCWKAREGLKVRAINHTEKIDRRSELTALIEEVGQESLLQEIEIAWPAQSKDVHRAHEHYAQQQQPGNLYTLPLIEPGSAGCAPQPRGSVSLERQKMPFTRAEQWALRLYVDMALAPLMQLHQRSRALPVRLLRETARSLPAALRPRTHLGRKLGAAMALALALIGIMPFPYWVSAVATVKTDTMAFVGAPFDGFLDSSSVQLGDQVRRGQTLFSLNTRELLLERASIQAEIAQALREAEKRRAANQLPEMQVAEAQAAQGLAKLQQVVQRIQSAEVNAPLEGVVIEGEPGKNLGGAVRRGDTVVKIAALSSLYVEASVSEKDLSRIEPGQSARLTLLAQPAETYRLKVLRIIPSASVVEGENAFPVRLELDGQAISWARPGMSGVAKVDIGWRPVAWIATHRLIDYLRVTFWI